MEEDKVIELYERRRDTDTWHLKKELNIGHLLTTVTLAVGLIAWGSHMAERMRANEVRIESLQSIQTTQLSDTRQMRTELLMEIRELRREIGQLYKLQQTYLDSRSGDPR